MARVQAVKKFRVIPREFTVEGGELSLTCIKEFEILLQDEEVLGPIVPGQGGDDLSL